jgi:hypothetical protein
MSAIKVEVYDPRLERTGNAHVASGRSLIKPRPNDDSESIFNMAAVPATPDDLYEALIQGVNPQAIRSQVGAY